MLQRLLVDQSAGVQLYRQVYLGLGRQPHVDWRECLVHRGWLLFLLLLEASGLALLCQVQLFRSL